MMEQAQSESVDKTTSTTAVADKAIADKAIADKTVSDKAVSDKAVADKAVSDKAVADKTVSDKTVSDKTSVPIKKNNDVINKNVVQPRTQSSKRSKQDDIGNKKQITQKQMSDLTSVTDAFIPEMLLRSYESDSMWYRFPSLARVVEGTIQSGEGIYVLLERANVIGEHADSVIRALRSKMNLRQLQVGVPYQLILDDNGILVEFHIKISNLDTVHLYRTDHDIVVEIEKVPVITKVAAVSGVINTSLYQAMVSSGEGSVLPFIFVDVFAFDVNFYVDTRKGDHFRMLVEKKYANDQFVGYGKIIAAQYKGDVGEFNTFWWSVSDSTNEGAYYDEKGQSVQKTFLKSPLKYSRISSRFNPRRMHPILHRVRGHWGVDYAAPRGTPVWAASDGRIKFRGRKAGGGKVVILKHGNGLETTYMHLHRFARGQKVGYKVKQKDVIGYVGSTGLATGPHLHFEVRKNKRYIDPFKLKMKRGPKIRVAQMDRFLERSKKLLLRLERIPFDSSEDMKKPDTTVVPSLVR